MKMTTTFIKGLLIAGLWMSFALNAQSQYSLEGAASSTGSECFIITPASNAMAGAIWSDQAFSLANNFDFTFQVYLGIYDTDGADGIAFVIQLFNSGLGYSGGGLGYMTLSPSLAVEFDTWQNDDPVEDHIAIQKNGDVSLSGTVAGPVQASSTSPNIEDGLWHTARITWHVPTSTMTVYFDGVQRLTYTDDIVSNIFGGSDMVHWGFTGATGGFNNLQQFCVTSLVFQEVSIPLSPWALGIAIFFILSITLLRYRKSIL